MATLAFDDEVSRLVEAFNASAGAPRRGVLGFCTRSPCNRGIGCLTSVLVLGIKPSKWRRS
jgi:hypothetical protein